jgi:hypothetical protein
MLVGELLNSLIERLTNTKGVQWKNKRQAPVKRKGDRSLCYVPEGRLVSYSSDQTCYRELSLLENTPIPLFLRLVIVGSNIR